MYRKQRLTPKLRKKQKIVVSTPQNLWYDTGNNPAQKGKTADMEKVEISGAALAPLSWIFIFLKIRLYDAIFQ